MVRFPRMLRRLVAGLAAVAVLGGTVLVAPPTAHAAPNPVSPAFGSIIDPYADYEPENTCDPTDKPGPIALRDLLTKTYGPATVYISRSCVSTGTSGHNAGRAADWMHDINNAEERDEVETFLDWLLAPDQFGNEDAMMRRLGLMYIIWNSQIYESYDPGWEPYYGSSPHTDHVHFSFAWDGAYKRTTYWNPANSFPAVPACTTPPVLAAPPPANYDAGLGYVPITPVRLLETRATGIGVPSRCRLPARGRLDVKVTGVAGVPSGGVGAVVLNLTGVNPDGGTYLAAYPAGAPWGGTSAVSIAAREAAAALVVVPVGTGGKISLLNGFSRTDAIVDIVGYHPVSGGALYNATVPKRVLDTRTSGDRSGNRETRTITLSSVPASATGVILNTLSVGNTAGGYVTVTAGGSGAGGTSTLNMIPGRAVSNRVYVALGTGRTVDLYTSAGTDVVLDVVGWFGPTGRSYVPLSPYRAFDSRAGTLGLKRFTGGVTQDLDLRSSGLPEAARIVVLTVTATAFTTASFATVWTHDRVQPATSDLNTAPGLNTSNLVVAQLGAGALDAEIGAGTGDLLGDVLGYFR